MLLVFQGNRALGKLLFHIYSFQDCRAHHTNIVDNECLQCLCSVKRGVKTITIQNSSYTLYVYILSFIICFMYVIFSL